MRKPQPVKQEFIRYRKADDAEHQQPEDGEIAVGRDPLEDGAFQPDDDSEVGVAHALLRAAFTALAPHWCERLNE